MAIFMRCGIFPYTLPRTLTLEVKPAFFVISAAAVEAKSSLLKLVIVVQGS